MQVCKFAYTVCMYANMWKCKYADVEGYVVRMQLCMYASMHECMYAFMHVCMLSNIQV